MNDTEEPVLDIPKRMKISDRRLEAAILKLPDRWRDVTREATKSENDRQAVLDGCYYDRRGGDHVAEFSANYIKHTKGKWDGEPFILFKWQLDDIITPLFSWMNKHGYRRYRMAYIEIAKKNGKSALASMIALYMLCYDDEAGGEVYSAATTRKQANIVFRDASTMVKKSPELKKRIQITPSQKHMSHSDSNSFYEAISSDVGASEGMNIHCLVFDEKHALKNREFWDALKYGGLSRTQSLIFVITTAGNDMGSVCYETHNLADKITKDEVIQTKFFSYIRGLDKDDDIEDEANWYKANPSLGQTIDFEDFKSDFTEAMLSATKLNVFKRYRLNMWVEAYESWISSKKWELNGGELDTEALKGRECFGGLDLGSTADLTSFSLTFPFEGVDKDGRIIVLYYETLWWFWAPKDNARKRQELDSAMYIDWARDGHIKLTPGDEVDYATVRKDINDICEQYLVKEIAVDRLFQGAGMCQELAKDGLEITKFGQGFYSMAAPSKEFEVRVNRGEFKHGDNPVLKWMAGHVVVKIDEADNMKPDKKRSTEKIDGIVTAVMGLGVAIGEHEEKFVSKYEDENETLGGV